MKLVYLHLNLYRNLFIDRESLYLFSVSLQDPVILSEDKEIRKSPNN